MTRLSVKVCGITSPEDGVAAAEAGADAVGMVFWPRSPRAVSVEQARAIGQALPPFVVRVGVFVDAGRDEMARVAEAAGLDMLQLHGDEPPEGCAGLPRRALKAVRVGAAFAPESALLYEGRVAGLLLDTGGDDAPGEPGRGACLVIRGSPHRSARATAGCAARRRHASGARRWAGSRSSHCARCNPG